MGCSREEVSANCYAKLASSRGKEPSILGVLFIRESIRARCHSQQDGEKNGAEIAALQIQKAWVALSTFKIGRRGGGMVNLYIPGRQSGSLRISVGNLTFALAH